MKINMTANLLGIKESVSKKDNNPYWIYTFADEEGQTIKCMTKNPNISLGLKRFASYLVDCDIFIGEFTRLNLLGLTPLESK